MRLNYEVKTLSGSGLVKQQIEQERILDIQKSMNNESKCPGKALD